MANTKAIITLIIGKHYSKRWKKLCAGNWNEYAKKHGYDIICIDEPLDISARAQSRSPAWQKCLILGDERVKKYNQVVWIDSDILINPNSPCIVSKVPEDKVGAVDMFGSPMMESFPTSNNTNELLINRSASYWGWQFKTGEEFYSKSKLSPISSCVVQTGVMVLSEKYHREILEDTYHRYEENENDSFEMESLSYELVKSASVYWLDCKFNRLWSECMLRDYPFLLPSIHIENKLTRAWKNFVRGSSQMPDTTIAKYCLASEFVNNYFLHFAGTSQYMPLLDTNTKDWYSLRGKL